MVQTTPTRRAFSLGEANATLPLVRAIVADLVELHADVVAREARVEHLLQKRTDKPRDAYDDELREIQRSLVDDRQQIARFESELESLGVRIRSSSKGIVEFPSWLGENPVGLVWHHNDNNIVAWIAGEGEEQWDIEDHHFTASPEADQPFRRR